MQKVYLDDIAKYENKIIVKDIHYKGQLLVKNNTALSKFIISRLENKKEYLKHDGLTYIYVYDDADLTEHPTIAKNNIIHEDIRAVVDEYAQTIFNRYSYQTVDDRETVEKIIGILFDDIFQKEYYTSYLNNMYSVSKRLLKHTVCVTTLSIIIAVKQNMPINTIISIGIGGLLHDIGLLNLFIQFPELADHSHELNYEEFQLIKTHSVVGYNEIKDNPIIPTASKIIVLYHHVWENWDKSFNKYYETYTSYPLTYKDEPIDASGKNDLIRIIQLADFVDDNLDYITKHHIFEDEYPDVFEFLRQNKSNIFGSKITNILLNYISRYSIGDKVKLTNGEIATVYKHTNDVNNPIVKIDATSVEVNTNTSKIKIAKKLG